jgi:hypothetical protein
VSRWSQAVREKKKTCDSSRLLPGVSVVLVK